MPKPTAPTLPAARRLADRLPQLLAMAVVTLLLVLLAGLSVWQGHARQHEQALGAAHNRARLLEAQVADAVGQADLLLRAAAAQGRSGANGPDRHDSRDSRDSANAATAALRTLAAAAPDLLNLRLADAQGRWRLRPDPATGEGPAAGSVQDSEAFQRARGTADSGLILTGPLRHGPDGPRVLVLSRGLHSAEGHFAGLVSVDLPVKRIESLWAATDLGDGGSASLRTATGALVSQWASALAGPAAVGSADVQAQLREALVLNPLAGEVETAAAPDVSRRTSVYRQLRLVPLVVLVGLPAQDFMPDWSLSDSTAVALALSVLAVLVWCAAAQRRGHRQALTEAMRQFAFDDPLTGLPSRRLLRDRLAHVQQASQRLGSMAALLVISLDALDRGGPAPHPADDKLRRAAALGLQAAVRKSDSVTWLGEDRFGVLCDNLGADPMRAEQRVLALVAKVHEALAQRLTLAGQPPRCSLRIGHRLFRGDGDAADQLIADAEQSAARPPQERGPAEDDCDDNDSDGGGSGRGF